MRKLVPGLKEGRVNGGQNQFLQISKEVQNIGKIKKLA